MNKLLSFERALLEGLIALIVSFVIFFFLGLVGASQIETESAVDQYNIKLYEMGLYPAEAIR